MQGNLLGGSIPKQPLFWGIPKQKELVAMKSSQKQSSNNAQNKFHKTFPKNGQICPFPMAFYNISLVPLVRQKYCFDLWKCRLHKR